MGFKDTLTIDLPGFDLFGGLLQGCRAQPYPSQFHLVELAQPFGHEWKGSRGSRLNSFLRKGLFLFLQTFFLTYVFKCFGKTGKWKSLFLRLSVGWAPFLWGKDDGRVFHEVLGKC